MRKQPARHTLFGLFLLALASASESQVLWRDALARNGYCTIVRAPTGAAGAADLRSVCERLGARSWATVADSDTSAEAAARACSGYTRETHDACAGAGVRLREPPLLMRLMDAPTAYLEGVSSSPAQEPVSQSVWALRLERDATMLIHRPYKPGNGCPELPGVLFFPDTIETTGVCSAVLVGATTLLTAAHCLTGNAAVMQRAVGPPVNLRCRSHPDFSQTVAKTCKSRKPGDWQPDCARDLAVCSSVDVKELIASVAPTQVNTDPAVVGAMLSAKQMIWLAGYGDAGATHCSPALGFAPIKALSVPDAATALDRFLITDGAGYSAARHGDSGGPAFSAQPPNGQLLGVISGFTPDPIRNYSFIAAVADQSLRCFLALLVASDIRHRVEGIDAGAHARWKC
jgi:hypothetical protein